MVQYILEPFGQGAEFLNVIKVDSDQENLELVIGRNVFTGLSDATRPHFQYVSRRHILITVKNGTVFMECVATQPEVVSYNGYPCPQNTQVPLRANDCMCLLSMKSYYNYRFRAVDDEGKPALQNQTSETERSAALNNTLTLSQSQPSANRTQSLGNSTNSNEESKINNIEQREEVIVLVSPAADSAGAEVVDLREDSSSSSSSSSSAAVVMVEVLSGTNTTSVAAALPPPVATAATAAAAAPPAVMVKVPSEADMMKDIVKKLLRQYECAICYETIACASSVHPCGDSFCLVCIADWAAQNKAGATSSSSSAVAANVESSCPYCQAKFTMSNVNPNRLADNAIRVILQDVPEELSAWEERLQQGNERRRQITESAKNAAPSSAATAPANGPPAGMSTMGRLQRLQQQQQQHEAYEAMRMARHGVGRRAGRVGRGRTAHEYGGSGGGVGGFQDTDAYNMPFPHNPAHFNVTEGHRGMVPPRAQAFGAPGSGAGAGAGAGVGWGIPPAEPEIVDLLDMLDSQPDFFAFDPFPPPRPAPAPVVPVAPVAPSIFDVPAAAAMSAAASHAYARNASRAVAPAPARSNINSFFAPLGSTTTATTATSATTAAATSVSTTSTSTAPAAAVGGGMRNPFPFTGAPPIFSAAALTNASASAATAAATTTTSSSSSSTSAAVNPFGSGTETCSGTGAGARTGARSSGGIATFLSKAHAPPASTAAESDNNPGEDLYGRSLVRIVPDVSMSTNNTRATSAAAGSAAVNLPGRRRSFLCEGDSSPDELLTRRGKRGKYSPMAAKTAAGSAGAGANSSSSSAEPSTNEYVPFPAAAASNNGGAQKGAIFDLTAPAPPPPAAAPGMP